jgi:hypothetical protein
MIRYPKSRAVLPGEVALLVPLALFGANHLLRSARPFAADTLVYFFVVTLALGTIVPLWTLRWLAHAHGVEPGFASRRWPLAELFGALGLGALLALAAVGERLIAEPGHALHLFVWVFTMSVAQVLVFLGIVYTVAHAWLAKRAPRWLAVALAGVFASALFGLFHFSYGPPWNSWPVVGRLAVIWLLVTAVFLVTRSLWAAVLFDTVMAVVGFLLRGIDELDRQPLALGLLLDAIVIATTLILSWRWRRKHSRSPLAARPGRVMGTRSRV